MSVTGSWNLCISSPVGTQSAVLQLTEQEGDLAGVAIYNGETLPLINPVLHDNQLTWQLLMTKPLRLHLTFDVTINGDSLAGTSKAGIFPPTSITGTRVK